MEKRRVVIRVVVIGLVVGALSWAGYQRTLDSSVAEEEGPPQEERASAVIVEEVERQHWVQSVGAMGILEASEELTIESEVTARIDALGFEEGEAVAQGQMLVRQVSDDLQAQRRAADRERQFLETEVQRRQQVYERDGIPRREVDEVETELALIEARLDELEAEIAKREVRAPFDGVVGLRHVSPGAVLSAQQAVATVRQVDPLALRFSVPARHARQVEKGQEVYFVLDDGREIERAEVTRTESALSQGSRMLRVEAEVENEGRGLVPGLPVRLRLVLGEAEESVVVPASAIVQSAEGPSAWVVEEGKAKEVEVTLGERRSDRVQIKEGLEEGDELIRVGYDVLNEGDAVDPEGSQHSEAAAGPDWSHERRRESWSMRQDLERMLRQGDIEESR